LHLVKLEKRRAPESVTFEEVRSVVERDCNDERRRAANREIFGRLKARYQITVDDAAITNVPAVKLAEAIR
jgi:parvulin-like peptidyl-prolyl isomerase